MFKLYDVSWTGQKHNERKVNYDEIREFAEFWGYAIVPGRDYFTVKLYRGGELRATATAV